MPDTRTKPAKAARPTPAPDFPIVAIGASAGGLDACTRLITELPQHTGMAFILVQHLDPNHESMMANLLAGHTAMAVQQASDGETIAAEHLYIIPPGRYLSVAGGKLHLSQPNARHGARLPFDFLLQSLAADCPARTIGVILSGTGADGSLGLKAVQDAGGFTIAQEPGEAGYGGMPQAAIAAGAIDLVLPVGQIAAALLDPARRKAWQAKPPAAGPDCLPDIIELLRTAIGHDFSLYKRGTLLRRIERRMGLAALDAMPAYLAKLRSDPAEIDLLAKDFLINVTGFFRDKHVFDLLAAQIVPDMVRDQPQDRPLRIWIPGCSTGEEAYSLAMLFREAIALAGRSIKLQVFASDTDVDAIAAARDGFYAETLTEQIGAERLARFFVKEVHGYRVSAELRANVVFTVQDVLSDPPFSRLDLVSCRNLLIYLGSEAQAKVIALFHFALREGGTLLLGSAESIGRNEGRFKVISKAERLYRHIGRTRPGDVRFQLGQSTAERPAGGSESSQVAHKNKLADMVHALVLEAHCPASVLINHRQESLFSTGRVERYLRIASGHPSHNVLDMAPKGLRTKLRSAIQQAIQADAPVTVTGGRSDLGEVPIAFDIQVRPCEWKGEALLLMCFVDVPIQPARTARSASPQDAARVAELEHELDATRIELQGAIHNLEINAEEQGAINDEALSVNEEFQSTNEELLTSKEELQSLNEELTALNSQLQETLDRQRITANDLQNVLYSTDVATLFLDTDLNIRFFTPSTTSLFKLIPSDIGRPLADLHSLSLDNTLTDDARAVLAHCEPIEREIPTESGSFFLRRTLPYRTDDSAVDGVVITYADVSEGKQTRQDLEAAKQQADRANAAKSRFLAAASHDLRQPLQTLALLQGLLAKAVEGPKAHRLVDRIDETLGVMSGMLNALLDINQIESGIVRPEISTFAVNDLLERMRDEFAYNAGAKHLALRLVPCRLSISSDPHLFEQMLRNLIANAIKYTAQGKILIGCRRRSGQLHIEIWDSGVGIDEADLQVIFDEYCQVDNAARERSRGLGLGLSIVKRLADLLGHTVDVRSVPGKGSVFSIGVAQAPVRSGMQLRKPGYASPAADIRTGTILIIEDDPEVRELLETMLTGEGHHVATALSGVAAVKQARRAKTRPELILSDYNLPGGINGVEATGQLRALIGHQVPVIILTGDISTSALRDIAGHDCMQINKPVKPQMLSRAIQRLLAEKVR